MKGRCPGPTRRWGPGTYVFYKTFSSNTNKVGGARRDRTADLLRATQALSQLSYSPEEARTLTEAIRHVNEMTAYFAKNEPLWL